jgi:hypothetical protein
MRPEFQQNLGATDKTKIPPIDSNRKGSIYRNPDIQKSIYQLKGDNEIDLITSIYSPYFNPMSYIFLLTLNRFFEKMFRLELMHEEEQIRNIFGLQEVLCTPLVSGLYPKFPGGNSESLEINYLSVLMDYLAKPNDNDPEMMSTELFNPGEEEELLSNILTRGNLYPFNRSKLQANVCLSCVRAMNVLFGSEAFSKKTLDLMRGPAFNI